MGHLTKPLSGVKSILDRATTAGVLVAFAFELVECLPHQHAIDATRNRSVATQDGRRQDACTFVQEAGDVVLVPANWAHAILNEAPVVGAAFEHLDAYLIASNSRRVFA